MDVNLSQLNFEYFTDFSDIFEKIEEVIMYNSLITIVLFLDDHGNEGHFANVGYFQIYKMLMKFPRNGFLIFNDSCNSGSMIDLIKSYNKIYESEIFNHIPKNIGGQVLFSFMNLFNSLLNKKKDSKEDDIIGEAKKLIDFYEKTEIVNDVSLTKNLNLNEKSEKMFNELLKLIGLNDKQEIKDFQIIYESFESTKDEYDLLKRYNKTKETFNEFNLNIVSNMIDDDIKSFIDTLKILYKDRKIIDFDLQPHPNIEIITSTDTKNVCFSYANLRKVNSSSPAMSAFIKEVFLKSDKTPFNFENIKKEMTDFNDESIFYPTNPDKEITYESKKRQWIGLYLQHYKSNEKKVIHLFVMKMYI